MEKIQPIILLGSARNGTTMLCNIVAEQSQVATIQHELHWGFHESNIYENLKYWGEFKTLDDYINFLEEYSSMDTFTISGLNKEDFYIEDYPKDFIEFYFMMMDTYAIKFDSKYWLTKIDPLYYLNNKELQNFINRLNARYENVKYISIQRNIHDVILSYLKMEGTYQKARDTKIGRIIAIFLGVSRYIVHYNATDKLLVRCNSCSFQYEHFIQNKDIDLKLLSDYLGLDFNSINQKYKPNSSFNQTKKKDKQLIIKSIISIFYYGMKFIPIFPKVILNLYENIKPKKRPDFWRLKKEKFFLHMYVKELTETSQFQLLEVLKERNNIL